MLPCLSTPPLEEDAGTEAGGRHGYDPKQGGKGAALRSHGGKLCHLAG